MEIALIILTIITTLGGGYFAYKESHEKDVEVCVSYERDGKQVTECHIEKRTQGKKRKFAPRKLLNIFPKRKGD